MSRLSLINKIKAEIARLQADLDSLPSVMNANTALDAMKKIERIADLKDQLGEL